MNAFTIYQQSRNKMAQKITNELVRVAFRSFGRGDERISNSQIFEALDIESEQEKSRVRTRITDMIKAGEIIKIGSGIYNYNFKFKLRDASTARGYSKIWRYIRQQKDGWSIKDCTMLTGQNNTHVSRYVNWLESEGYVEIIGKGDNNARLYKGTLKARQTPETPIAPHTDKDPFEKERIAGAKIIRLLLCNDLYSKATAKDIADACEVLLGRFSKNINTNDGVSVTINENEQIKKQGVQNA